MYSARLIPFDEPIQIVFVVDMPQDAFMSWYQLRAPGGAEAWDEELISGKEANSVDQPDDVPLGTRQHMSVTTLPYSDGKTNVTARCLHPLVRPLYEDMLLMVFEEFVYSRTSLCKAIEQDDNRRVLPVLAARCDERRSLEPETNFIADSARGRVDKIYTLSSRSSRLSVSDLDIIFSRFLQREGLIHTREEHDQVVIYQIQDPDDTELLLILLAQARANQGSSANRQILSHVSWGTVPGLDLYACTAAQWHFIESTTSRISDELELVDDPVEYWAPQELLSLNEAKAIYDESLLSFTSDTLPKYIRYRCETSNVGEAFAYTLYCYVEDIEFPFARLMLYPAGKSWGESWKVIPASQAEDARDRLIHALAQKFDKEPDRQMRRKGVQLPNFSEKVNSLRASIDNELRRQASLKRAQHSTARGQQAASQDEFSAEKLLSSSALMEIPVETTSGDLVPGYYLGTLDTAQAVQLANLANKNVAARVRADAEKGDWIDRVKTAASSANEDLAREGQSIDESIRARAERYGIQPPRLLRWERIQQYYRDGLTQEDIAAKEDRSVDTIKADYRDMRKHGLLPPLRK